MSALVVVAAILAFTGHVRFPTTPQSWAGYLLIPVVYGLGVMLFFVAASMIGAVRTSMIMNFEPVAAIVLGYLVLGQTLSPLQLLGGALALSALFFVHSRKT